MATLTHDRPPAFPGLADLLHLDVDLISGPGARRDLLRAAIARYGAIVTGRSTTPGGWSRSIFQKSGLSRPNPRGRADPVFDLARPAKRRGAGIDRRRVLMQGRMGTARSVPFRTATPLATAQIPADEGHEDQRRRDHAG